MALKSNYSTTELFECGCDEVGRGCLAGPVCAAAVIFPYGYKNDEINDSKQMSARQRERLRQIIEKDAVAYAVAEVSEAEIDRINILQASIKCMNKAVGMLPVKPDFLLVDGNRFSDEHNIPYKCVVKGDATFVSIAAASILAKTYRDAMMTSLDAEFPQYDWKNNKGYATKKHTEAVVKYGLTRYHRKSFHLKNQLSFDFGK